MLESDLLTEAELVAEIIPYQAIKELEIRYNDLQTALLNTTIQELEQIKGIGKKKAKQLMSVSILAKRLYQTIQPPHKFIKSPEDVYINYAYLQANEVEEFHIVCLDVKNGVKMSACISIGTTNASFITDRDIFCTALRCRASGIILIHNHPSGDTTPSKEDKETTKHLVEVGKFLDIKVHDHIIIGKGKYYSVRENQIKLYEQQIFQ